MTSQFRWYKFLNNEEQKDSLHRYESIEPMSLIVCMETEYRKYAKFSNAFEFGKYLMTSVNPENRCCYEIIYGDFQQKPYFDLDIPIKQTGGIELQEALQLEGVPKIELKAPPIKKLPAFSLTPAQAEKAILDLQETILQRCPQIQAKDIMIFSSHGPKKRSYHLVVDNWCLTSNRANRAFHDEIMKYYPPEWHPAVDHSMYKSVQQFRMFANHKWQTSRVKVLAPICKWVPPVTPLNDKHKFSQVFAASLICNASYCTILPFYGDYEALKPKFQGSEYLVSEEEVEKVLDMCKVVHRGDFPFHLIEVKESMICLKRDAPSMCLVCRRVHEAENPFVIVIGEEKNIYFNCRRHDKNQKLFIGRLEKSSEVSPTNLVNLKIDSPPRPPSASSVPAPVVTTPPPTPQPSLIDMLHSMKRPEKKKTTPVTPSQLGFKFSLY